MMIFNSKEEDEVILNSSAPSMVSKFLKKDSKIHYQKLKDYLDLLKIPYTEDHTLVLDSNVYTNSVWQFKTNTDDILVT
jgi:histidyl-tRNA synthetase